MGTAITPQHVIDVINSTINYLDIDLPEESLSPSCEMGRVEQFDQLVELVHKLTLVKSFTTTTTGKSPAQNVAPPVAKKTSTIAKQPATTAYSTTPAPDNSQLDSIRSKLKVLLKWSIGELKQNADFYGHLKKHKKQGFSKWNQRFCVLRDGILLYFDSDKESGKGKGYMVLAAYKFSIPPNSNGFTFELEVWDKSTSYTFQADQKKDIENWKQHLTRVTDRGYTKDQLNAINAMVKEIVFSSEQTDDGDAGVGVNENNDEGETYDEIATQSHSLTIKSLPLPAVAKPPPVHGVPAPLHALPVPLPVQPPAQEKEVIPLEEEDIYEDIGPTSTVINNTTTTPYLPTHVVHKPATEQFSTHNVYVGLCDCVAEVGTQDLSFACGDVMYILDRVDVNWWIACHLNGTTGLVPKNFLREAFTV